MYQLVTGFTSDQVLGEKFSKFFESRDNSWQRIRTEVLLGKVSVFKWINKSDWSFIKF